MQISITGKQIEIGEALKTYVEEKLSSAVNKYFDRAIKAHVVFSKEAHLFRADVVVNEGTGHANKEGYVQTSDPYCTHSSLRYQ